MKAFAITKPGELSVVELPEPILQAGQVLLEILRVGYCGSDLNTFRGSNPLVTYPRIPGHEVAGKIIRVTPEVPREFRVGLTVTVLPYSSCGECSSCRSGRTNACRRNQTLGVQRDGAMAEFVAVPWETLVFSEGLSTAEHALIEPLSVGFHAVDRGAVNHGDTVLVFGCGMIGLGAISGAALMRKARLIAVDIDDGKLALASQAGASLTINSRSENLREKLQQYTAGEGPSVVIEAVGSPVTFRLAVDEVGFAGRVVYIGYAKDAVSYDTKLFVLKELDIRGSRNATKRDFEDVIRVLGSGLYPTKKTITTVVPFAEAGSALTSWAADPTRVTKIHVDFSI